MVTASRLEGISEYYFAGKLREIAQLREQGRPVINLGIGSPDLAPHPDVVSALTACAAQPNAHGYQSYTGIPALREAISNWYSTYYGVSLNPGNEILPLMGSKEGIVHLAMTWLQAGDMALVPDPGYPAYRAATLLAGATPLPYDLKPDNDWLPNFKALEQRDLSKVKIMWVNYPNMPTGRPAESHIFEQLVHFGKRHNILIINDNPYSFILNEQPQSILSIAGARDVAMELNSLSKAQNMAGWRVGMLLGRADRISEVIRFKSNMDSGMFLPVQQAAIAALQLPRTWYDELNYTYAERQKIAIQILESQGCVMQPKQQGLFVWGQVPARFLDAYALSDELLYNHNIFLTPGGIFGKNGTHYIRISLCSPVSILQEALQRLTS
jgi:LL-diaminopimelate aminotransferase